MKQEINESEKFLTEEEIIEIFKKICYNYNRIKEKGENKNGWKTL